MKHRVSEPASIKSSPESEFFEAYFKDAPKDAVVRHYKYNFCEFAKAFHDQYSTPQEGRGRYVSDEEIKSRSVELYGKEPEEAHLRVGFFAGFKDCQNQIFTSPPEMEREEAINFATWYGGMKREKAEMAYEAYLRESPPRSVGDKKGE